MPAITQQFVKSLEVEAGRQLNMLNEVGKLVSLVPVILGQKDYRGGGKMYHQGDELLTFAYGFGVKYRGS